jgi:ribose 5-phosphate isomerase RpiB
MSANGEIELRWTGPVLSGEHLRRSLNGHRCVRLAPRTVLTPLAAEELRAAGVSVERERPEPAPRPASWGVARERAYPMVDSVLRSLEREGVGLWPLGGECKSADCEWAKALAECVARGECVGGVVFCSDPALVSCVANKLPGLRAVAVSTVAGAARAVLSLGANLVAVEMPGRTYFELVQIVRTVCRPGRACPSGVACTLEALDGANHAGR